MYKKIDTSLNFASRELKVLKFWQDNQVFEKTLEKTEGGQEFTFYDGPPTANGKPHIGHILTRVIKDIIPRYKTMKGMHVLRKAGWDTHGLPVELEVEKSLGMDGKQDIEKYGIENFIKKCKESVWKYTSEWKKMSERVSYWVDMEHPYVTYDDKYIESVWWSLKTIFDKGLIYKGHKIVPYCPRCGTALSSHEVAQGYKDVEETTAVVRFKVKGQDTFILAWTTTPWTLPSNVALCFNPDCDYALIESGGVRYIAAEALISTLFEEYTTISVKKGKEYEGTEYEPLFGGIDTLGKKAYYAVCDGYVTLTEGTGIVHIAPAFGEDDSRVGRKYDLPVVQTVDERGRMTKGAPFDGTFCKDADKLIISNLKERGLLFKTLKVKHSYPFCWRCDTPLLYYARSTWFIKVTAVKDELIKNNASVNWIPETIGKGRMGNFLENVIDWGISRDRYWGTPLPIWVCEKCGHQHAVGSKEELKKLGGIEGEIELHKPYVDGITFTCPVCGGVMKRTPEVIDCWYDSGSMPFAQLHYPFENKEAFNQHFPADFISEAVDQTRGWFYTLLAVSTLLFDKAPFKNCIVLGHVNDKNGVKMSKHKGNVVDPWTVLDKFGSDAVRWYFYTNSSPWLPSRFYEDAVAEAQRKYLGTLWNTFSFYMLYAEIDKFNPYAYKLENCRLTLMDKWVLSELNSLTEFVGDCLENYKITESARAIEDFTDKLSNWYVRRCRDRYWGGGMDEDKTAAYMTLFTVLDTLCRLTAPYTPLIAESIYQSLVREVNADAPISVHLTEFPSPNKAFIDKELEKGMDTVLKITVLGRAARNLSAIKNRQPLSRMLVGGYGTKGLIPELLEVAEGELNVKEIDFIDGAAEYVSYEVKPQLKTLGPKYGKKLPLIREYLKDNADIVVAEVKKNGTLRADLDGEVELSEDDLLIVTKSREGFAVQSDGLITVILDTQITPELLKEGYVREIISKIQTMRKDSGFEVTDRIVLGLKCGGEVKTAVEKFKQVIADGVLAEEVRFNLGTNAKEWDINGETVSISVEKV